MDNSEENKALPEGAAAKGGEARADSLSSAQRKDIAKRAAEARWGMRPIKALKEAILKIKDAHFECAVLEGEIRVISQRGFSRAIGAKRGGSHWQRQKRDVRGANLPVFMSATNLRPFISLDLAAALSKPIIYQSTDGHVGYGIRAELIPQILDVWLKARDAGKLLPAQQRFAAIAEILTGGLAATGIVALIDEATGHQYDRARDALAKVLEVFVAKAIRKWVRTFPVTWFMEICRIKGIEFREDMKLPKYFGHIVNDLVYDRLAPGVRAKLQEKNPVTESGRRKHKNFQWLTDQVGLPELIHLLGMEEGIAKAFEKGDWDGFYKAINRLLPAQPSLPLFELQNPPNDNHIKTEDRLQG